MKRFYALLLAGAILGAQACKKSDNDPQTEKKELTMLGVVGFETEFPISSSGRWSIEILSGIDWLQLDKHNGTGDAILKFTTAKSVTSPQQTTVKLIVNGSPIDLVVKIDPFYTNTDTKTLGGEALDQVLATIATADGGYLLAGTTISKTGDFNDNTATPGDAQAVVAKYDQAGAIQWKKYLGGNQNDQYTGVAQTTDGGYILVGSTLSTDGVFAGNKGGFDIFVQKLNKDGAQQWLKFFGSTKDDYGGDVALTQDGTIFVTGISEGINGDFNSHGHSDAWMACLDNTGTVKWKRSYGGTQEETGKARVAITADGNLVFCASTNSMDGDLSNNVFEGFTDAWLCKVKASNGDLIWSKTFGGASMENINSIIPIEDGGVIAAGQTYSRPIYGQQITGISDGFVLKVNANGEKQWLTLIDHDGGLEALFSISKFKNTGFIASGTRFNSAGVSDGFLCLLDGSGKKAWTKVIGGSKADHFTNLSITKDNTVIASGISASNDEDIPGNAGDFDIFMHSFK
ncbi:MAG: hypothetical protein J7578_10515 [Chitinophagaceae bacterium]|nr:hypothetical protein [Chitinophagaceae bacterium]